ncbi:MAG: acyl-CoA dehydrogenase family protein [Candidatus Eisenbacteria bacterium]
MADPSSCSAAPRRTPRRRARGVTAFLVEKSTPGVRVSKTEDKMGLRASDTAEIVFEECRIPAAQRLGEEGQGFKVAMSALDNGRIGVASQALGIAEGAFAEAVQYAKTRKQFGQPIAEFQAIQFMIADMDTSIEAARGLIRHAAHRKDTASRTPRRRRWRSSSPPPWRATSARRRLQIRRRLRLHQGVSGRAPRRDQRITEIYEGTR